jgi:branched-chain amino acid transport system substrate-binding protein
MKTLSRRRFLQLSALTGGALVLGPLVEPILGSKTRLFSAWAEEPIKIGILDPLSSPYKTSSIHDVHGANVALDAYNKSGGVLGRMITITEADDASNVETAVKMANKLIKDNRVDFLMGTFNGEVALAVSEVAKREDKLFMVTGAYDPDLTGQRCESHTFVFMPNAWMLARAVVPQLVKAYGNKWYLVTADTVDGHVAGRVMTSVLKTQGGDVVGETVTKFGNTDFMAAFNEAKAAKPNAVILNLYGWDLVHALKAYAKSELSKEKVGVGGILAGEQIGRPLGYENNHGIWGLIWDPKVNTESSRRFIQGVIDKYNHTPTSRCYLGYAAMTQILEAVKRAGTTQTQPVIEALAGSEFDGLKQGRSYFRRSDHQHVQDVLVGKAYGKELGLGHYQILATLTGDTIAAPGEGQSCKLA